MCERLERESNASWRRCAPVEWMAYMTRKIKVQGDQADLMQLQKLML
jgi:hypothetical protein